MLPSRLPCLRLVVTISVMAVVLAVVPLPFHGMLANALQDALHALGFAGFTFLVLHCSHSHGDHDARMRRRRLAIALGVVLALAVLTEGAQYVTPRDSNPWDFARDLIGIGLGFGAWLAVLPLARRVRVTGVVLALAAAVATAVPVFQVAHALRARATSLPVIHDFTRGWEMRFVGTRDAKTARVTLDGPPPREVLRIVYERSAWPSTIFRELPGGWTEDQTLVLELHNPGASLVRLGLRLDDRSDSFDFEDRFQRAIQLEPGWTTVRIPLWEVVAEVTGHAFDVGAVRTLALFALRGPRPVTIHVDAIRIED